MPDSLRVMGLDSSMTHTGYHVSDVSALPITTGYPDGLPTYAHMRRVAGGCLKQDDASIPFFVRIAKQTEAVHELVEHHRPDLLVVEDALDVGGNASPSGVALLSTILFPFYPVSTPGLRKTYLKRVVLITPERLQSMAHGERSTSGTVVVQRYKERFMTDIRVTHHEADAAFLAYHGSRFILTAVDPQWTREILNPKEDRIFFTAEADVKVRKKGIRGLHKTGDKRSTAMKDLKGTSWWEV